MDAVTSCHSPRRGGFTAPTATAEESASGPASNFELLERTVKQVLRRLQPPAALREDLWQEGILIALEIARRFSPKRADLPQEEQLVRYLLVVLPRELRRRWHEQSNVLRSPRKQHRIRRQYEELVASSGPVSLAEAASRLGVDSDALQRAIKAPRVFSLDTPMWDDDTGSLYDRIADDSVDIAGSVLDRDESSVARYCMSRRIKGRQLLEVLFAELDPRHVMLLKTAFALRERPHGHRACRRYGCMTATAHVHSAAELASWYAVPVSTVTTMLQDAIQDICELPYGRRALRVLGLSYPTAKAWDLR